MSYYIWVAAMKKYQLSEKDMNLLLQYGLQGLCLKHAKRHLYEQDEFLSHAGEPLDSIYFVVSGKAKVFISLSSGKQLLLAYFTSKGIIGDIELMTNKPTNYTTVRAVTGLACIALPLSIYAEELRNNNIFVNYVAKELAEKLTQRVINGAITTLQPLEARLCASITQTASDGFFRETLIEVAVVVGASYRHLLRCLKKLCGKKILRKELSGYRIINQRILDDNAGDLYVLR
jgi:CRP-like cAMP-binding protein